MNEQSFFYNYFTLKFPNQRYSFHIDRKDGAVKFKDRKEEIFSGGQPQGGLAQTVKEFDI